MHTHKVNKSEKLALAENQTQYRLASFLLHGWEIKSGSGLGTRLTLVGGNQKRVETAFF